MDNEQNKRKEQQPEQRPSINLGRTLSGAHKIGIWGLPLIGEVITIQTAPEHPDDNPARMVYKCKSCGRLFLNRPPEHAATIGKVYPHEGRRAACGPCTDRAKLEAAVRNASQKAASAAIN